MKRVHMRLAEADLAILDKQAKSAGISRAEFLRSRVLSSSNGRTYSTEQYHQLVAKAQRLSNLPRAQVEQLVNFLFVQFMGPHGEESSPCV